MTRVVLPAPLRRLAQVDGEVRIELYSVSGVDEFTLSFMDGRLTEERVERPGRVLDLGRVTGLGMASGVEFAGIEDVELLLGAGQDQFTMGEVSTGTDQSAIATVALYGGPGEDRIDVLESMAPNELTVSGDSGDDFITLAGTTAGTDPQSFGTTIYGEDINVATLRQGTPDGAGAQRATEDHHRQDQRVLQPSVRVDCRRIRVQGGDRADQGPTPQ